MLLFQVDLQEEARENAEIEHMLRDAGFEIITSADTGEPDTSHDAELALKLSEDPDCSIDEFLAQQMQREFDREQELQAQFESTKAKGGVAKAIVGQDPYHYFHEDEEEIDEDEVDDDEEFRELAINILYSNLQIVCIFKNPTYF